MKTSDVRIFGYFYRAKVFIAVCGNLAGRLKKEKLYDSYRKNVVEFRRHVLLDPPPYMTGDLHALT